MKKLLATFIACALTACGTDVPSKDGSLTSVTGERVTIDSKAMVESLNWTSKQMGILNSVENSMGFPLSSAGKHLGERKQLLCDLANMSGAEVTRVTFITPLFFIPFPPFVTWEKGCKESGRSTLTVSEFCKEAKRIAGNSGDMRSRFYQASRINGLTSREQGNFTELFAYENVSQNFFNDAVKPLNCPN
ncbi:hypothetical protein K2X30_05335 [bacterium]|nr:hypothetical protein [bacterium]